MNIVQSRRVIPSDLSRDCAGGPCSPTSRCALWWARSFCIVPFQYSTFASRFGSLQPLTDRVARRTFSNLSETKSSGQNDRSGFPPLVHASWFFISRIAQVRHLRAVAGADGDCKSHFGFNSARAMPVSLKVVMSVIRSPNGSVVARYTPWRRLERLPSISATRSWSLQCWISPRGRHTSSWSTSSSGLKRGRMFLSKFRAISW